MSIFEFIEGLIAGDAMTWIALGGLIAMITFFILYEKITGKPFVKSRRERREARRRRKHVI